MTFKRYVAKHAATGGLRGDFVSDAKDDSEFPDVKTWDELDRYLWRCRADPGAFKAARLVWDDYMRWRKLA